MAATLRIDTLKFVRRLTGAGMERQMAEAIADGLTEADTSDLATKADFIGLTADLRATETSIRSDLAATEASIRSDLAATEASLRSEIAAVRADLKAEIADCKAEIFRFMMVQAATIVGLTVTLIKLLP